MKQKYTHYPEFKNHEQIIELDDKESGLKGFIVIHNTEQGPALGGTRIFPYKSKKHALKDALKLSEAMTYKSSIAGLHFGGGKGVIIADPKNKDIKKILRAYALKILELKGKFYTGEDVGLSGKDVHYMLKFCPYFIGKKGQAGDPSPFAALSAFYCIQVALEHKFGSSSLKNKKFAIKGVGKTGSALAAMLYKAGAKVIISDLDKNKTKKLKSKYKNIQIVPVSAIKKVQTDVYVPCALGGDLNLQTAKRIQAKIICGTANNQIDGKNTAEKLFNRGVIHIPDYISNAGGLINVSAELIKGGYSKDNVLKLIQKLKPILATVLDKSDITQNNPDKIAADMAEKSFAKSFQKLKTAAKQSDRVLNYA